MMLARFSRWFIYFAVNIFLRIIANVNMGGIEKIPSSGKFIIAANHLGSLDAFLIMYLAQATRLKNPVVVVAEKYEKYAIYRWAVKKLGFMFIDRNGADLRALRYAYNRLMGGDYMVIAPEGTRSHTGALIEAKPGAAYLASKAQAQIYPAGIRGTEDTLVKERFKKLKRLDIKVVIGEPFEIPELPRKNREAFLQSQTEEIMCRIAAVLPPAYRGVYANHPRLKELIF
jgi:1-acyl-sn-glycerol-3-phosphate acyltransferase